MKKKMILVFVLLGMMAVIGIKEKKEQKKTWQEEVLLAIEVVVSIIRDALYKKVVGGAERSGAEALLFESSFFSLLSINLFC